MRALGSRGYGIPRGRHGETPTDAHRLPPYRVEDGPDEGLSVRVVGSLAGRRFGAHPASPTSASFGGAPTAF